MAEIPHSKEPPLTDEPTGTRPHPVATDNTLEVMAEAEPIAAPTPTNWWRRGLIALAIVVAILLLLQLLLGNTGTEMIPGTPTAAPQTEQTGQ
jgi:hypothetical protein